MKRYLALLLLLLSSAASAQQSGSAKLLTLSINDHNLSVMVASTPAERQMGLMFRTKLEPNQGMLFVYTEAALHAMWMKNTNLPLSVAFVDAQGSIINIEDMQPHTLDSHAARRPAKFSIEVNQGWFKQRGIAPGAKVKGLEKAPKPQ